MRLFKIYSTYLLLLSSSAYCTFYNDLKHMLMYLTEPLIHGESISSMRLDGAHTHMIIPFIDKIVEKTLEKHSGEEFVKLNSFREVLAAGFDISIKLPTENKLLIQILLKQYLDSNLNKWIYIPTFWSGMNPHAIVIGLRKTDLNNYDMAVINSGDGAGYHYSEQEANGNYPLVTQLWMDFCNIDENDLFDEKAWFIEALQRIRDQNYAKKIVSLKTYFYGTILVNLRQYLNTNFPSDRDLLIVTQRSGTCTMSSILATMLHHVRDRKLYFLYRLAMGQEILSDFLEKYEYKDNDDLKFLLGDGLELFGRKIFSSVPSGLANFTAQYLEELYPEVFKNSILIGQGHSNWLLNKKNAAVESLSLDVNSFQLLKITVDLGIRVHGVLKRIPYNDETTRIVTEHDDKELCLNKMYIDSDFFAMGELNTEMTDPLESFDVIIPRPTGPPITNLSELKNSLLFCTDLKTRVAFFFV